MESQKKSNEENIHLLTFLPSNVLSELDSNQNFPDQSDEKSFFSNQINFNSINCFSNSNNDNIIRMNIDIDIEKDIPTDSNQSNQTNYYSSLFHEEDQKIKQSDSNNKENNLFIFNNPNEINNFCLNNIQYQKKMKVNCFQKTIDFFQILIKIQ